MNNSNIVLRLKKTIYFMDKILVNFPKNEFVLKNRISDALFDMLENSYKALNDSLNKVKIINFNLTKMKMLDFYLKLSFDKGCISHKNIKVLSLHLKEITELFYAWGNKK